MEKGQTILEIEKEINGKVIKQIKYIKPVNPKVPSPPPSLVGSKAMVVNVLQSLGNSIVIGSLSVICFLHLVIFRSHYPEVILTCCFNAGLIVANFLVSIIRQPVFHDIILTTNQCKASHLAIFYAYSVAYTFGIMLSHQIFYIRGAYKPKGWQCSLFFNVWFSVMIPTIPTMIIAASFWADSYGVRLVTEASCMGDLSSNVSRIYCLFLFFCQLGPIIVNLEDGSIRESHNAPLVGQDFVQRKVARKASQALFVVLMMSMTSHVLTIASTYSQSIFLSTVVFGINVATAIVAFLMQLRLHVNSKVEIFVMKWLSRLLQKVKRPRPDPDHFRPRPPFISQGLGHGHGRGGHRGGHDHRKRGHGRAQVFHGDGRR